MSTTKATTVPDRVTPRTSSRFGLRHLMFAIVVLAVLLAMITRFGRELLFLILTLSPVLLVGGIVVVLVKRRDENQKALLRFLAIAAERRMPLAPGIEACAELCGGRYRRRALGLARLIESGVPLPAALEAIPGLLPRPAFVLAHVGWNEGALAPALRDAESAVAARSTYRFTVGTKLAYLIGILLAMQVILGFMFYFIIPRFEAIFADFGIGLPWMTATSIQVGHILISSGLLPLLILLEFATLAYMTLSFLGYLTWEPPPLGRLLRRRDTATIQRALAVGIEAGRPLGSILSSLARSYPRARIRDRLRDAAGRVELGEPWLAVMRDERLFPASDMAALEAASRAGNLPWTLRVLADGHDRRLGFRIAAISQALFPLIILTLAAIIGLFVVSLFLPLIQLINALAETP